LSSSPGTQSLPMCQPAPQTCAASSRLEPASIAQTATQSHPNEQLGSNGLQGGMMRSGRPVSDTNQSISGLPNFRYTCWMLAALQAVHATDIAKCIREAPLANVAAGRAKACLELIDGRHPKQARDRILDLIINDVGKEFTDGQFHDSAEALDHWLAALTGSGVQQNWQTRIETDYECGYCEHVRSDSRLENFIQLDLPEKQGQFTLQTLLDGFDSNRYFIEDHRCTLCGVKGGFKSYKIRSVSRVACVQIKRWKEVARGKFQKRQDLVTCDTHAATIRSIAYDVVAVVEHLGNHFICKY
jgi:hypothetical protein